MLRTCIELAYVEQRVVVFLEPIALYMTRDLHEKEDKKWLFPYPDFSEKIHFGEMDLVGDARELLIITYGNGFYLSLQAQKILQEKYHIAVAVLNLRWHFLYWVTNIAKNALT